MRTKFGPTFRGFTLIELLVSIAIIAILITLVSVGVSHALKTARGVSERQTMVSLNQGVQAFKQEFGFLPPLVTADDDSVPNIRPVEFNPSNAPVINSYGGTVANTKSYNANSVFLEGFQGGTPQSGGTNMMTADWNTAGLFQDRRFSEYSLAYYLVGALPRGVDGVDGPGMFKPKADGTFEFATSSNSARVSKVTGRAYPAFVETARNSPRMLTDLTTSTAKDANLQYTDPDTKTVKQFVARYKLVSPGGKAYRYYRWSPRKNGPTGVTYPDATGNLTRAEDGSDLLDVPSLLGDPRSNQDLRSAEYAILSCGPDGYFGDIPLEGKDQASLDAMAAKIRTTSGPIADPGAVAKVRTAARLDNVMEVGR